VILLKYYPSSFLEGLRKYTNKLCQLCRCLDRYVNTWSLEYYAVLLTTQPWLLLTSHCSIPAIYGAGNPNCAYRSNYLVILSWIETKLEFRTMVSQIFDMNLQFWFPINPHEIPHLDRNKCKLLHSYLCSCSRSTNSVILHMYLVHVAKTEKYSYKNSYILFYWKFSNENK
jgi:hypothetical protein